MFRLRVTGVDIPVLPAEGLPSHRVTVFSNESLQGSSDDGNATLKLHFSRPLQQDSATEEVICPKLQELLFFMHSFLTAKVASLDPSFLTNKP